MNTVSAFDAICTLIKDAWEAASTGPILWPDKNSVIPTSGEWARVSIQHGDGGQDSLSDANGIQKFASTGIVYVQVFTELGNSHPRGYELAEAILNAFRKAKISGMMLRRGRIREIGADGAFYHIQALTAFEYESNV